VRLAKFFRTTTLRADVVEGLISDTMLEVTESIEWFETRPPMSRCVPNSISCSEFPNHIRERAHRGC
jgi:hypothetical protein